MKTEKIKYCSHCKLGEIYDEPAIAKIRHAHPDSDSLPPITRYICGHHYSMLLTELGEDRVKELDGRVNQPPLSRTEKKRRAVAAAEPIKLRSPKHNRRYSVEWGLSRDSERRNPRGFYTNNAERALSEYDDILVKITKEGGWVKAVDHAENDLVIAEATITKG